MFHPGRGLGGPRARRTNMHFTSGSTGGLSSSSSQSSSYTPSNREAMDPIAGEMSRHYPQDPCRTGQSAPHIHTNKYINTNWLKILLAASVKWKHFFFRQCVKSVLTTKIKLVEVERRAFFMCLFQLWKWNIFHRTFSITLIFPQILWVKKRNFCINRGFFTTAFL